MLSLSLGVVGSTARPLGSATGVLGTRPGVVATTAGPPGTTPGVLGTPLGVLGTSPRVLGSIAGVLDHLQVGSGDEKPKRFMNTSQELRSTMNDCFISSPTRSGSYRGRINTAEESLSTLQTSAIGKLELN